jgi:hypothetical protein
LAYVYAKQLGGELASAFHLFANPSFQGLGLDLLRLLDWIVLLAQLIQ